MLSRSILGSWLRASASRSVCSRSQAIYRSASSAQWLRCFSSLPDHIVLTMPALSPTMEVGNLSSWEKKEGDRVEENDVVAQVETDKAVVAFESVEEGYIAKILMPEGTEDVAVGTPIAILAEEAEDVAAFADYTVGDAGSAAAPTPAAPAAAAAATPSPSPPPPPPAAAVAATPAAAAVPPSSSGGHVAASPLARNEAATRGISLSSVTGTGPRGRIVFDDVLEFKGAIGSASVGGYMDLPLSNVRKIIAQRLTEAKQDIPHYYVTVNMRMDDLLATRKELNASLGEEEQLSVNDFLVKAASLTLIKVPECNSAFLKEQNMIRQFSYADVSIAVATDGGLITPIVVDADIKGLAAIASSTRALIEKARSNSLTPEEYQGGTFTVSNLGMYGVAHFASIINPPQVCSLAVGAPETKVVAVNTEFGTDYESQQTVSVTLSSDHRVVDGAVAATFLKTFKAYIENPKSMLL
jgi:pyruvate dehydrogenase E2 component (dihydrolipoamide acetyltransferase)